MFAPNLDNEASLRFSRFDEAHLLATCARPIQLEGQEWPSAEHYVHAMLAGNSRLAKATKEAPTALAAYRINKPWYRSKKKGWKTQRRVYMTRAVYTLVQMYSDIREYLLDTGEQALSETSLYDHYWGVGRDWRGENMVGRVWMDVRKKLRDDAEAKENSVAEEA
ncbi:MAG: NADAR family protein [Agarilytica sp.]